jgi:hypothetical protein
VTQWNGQPTLSGLRLKKDSGAFFPGLPKRNPGLKLANAFSVIVALLKRAWARKKGEAARLLLSCWLWAAIA